MFEAKSLSLIHMVRPPQVAAGMPPLLVLLHGFGSNEQDLFSMAPYIDRRFLVVSARAPLTLGPGSYAWFELGISSSEVQINLQQVDRVRNGVIQFIDEVVAAYGADQRQVYVMGFSQGAMMSAGVTLTRPDLIAGAVMMSGSVPPELVSMIGDPAKVAGKPFLVTHGTYDPVLPIAQGRAGRDALAALGVDLVYHEYAMAHEVNPESFRQVLQWLSEHLDQAMRR